MTTKLCLITNQVIQKDNLKTFSFYYFGANETRNVDLSIQQGVTSTSTISDSYARPVVDSSGNKIPYDSSCSYTVVDENVYSSLPSNITFVNRLEDIPDTTVSSSSDQFVLCSVIVNRDGYVSIWHGTNCTARLYSTMSYNKVSYTDGNTIDSFQLSQLVDDCSSLLEKTQTVLSADTASNIGDFVTMISSNGDVNTGIVTSLSPTKIRLANIDKSDIVMYRTPAQWRTLGYILPQTTERVYYGHNQYTLLPKDSN